MHDDCECDLCRAGVAGDPVAMREFLRRQGQDGPPPLNTRRIARHVGRFAGEYQSSLADRSPELFPVEVLVFPPQKTRPYLLLVTSGMSDLPMIAPPGSGIDLAWTELAICLPADWSVNRKARQDPRLAWPLTLLQQIARLPYDRGAWVWYHQTLSWNLMQPFADNIRFNSLLFHPSLVLPEEFMKLSLDGGKEIHFLSLYPLYPEELALCVAEGAHALIDRLEEHGVTDLFDPGRASVCPEGRLD